MDELRLIDADLLKTNIAQIAKCCAKSDKQKALVGRILFLIDNMPTIDDIRLIDANALKRTLAELECESNNLKYQRYVNITLHEIMPQIIDDEPTINPPCHICNVKDRR